MALKQRIAPLLILVALLVTAALIVLNPPEQPSDAGDRRLQMAVETRSIEARPYQVIIESYGRVEPTTQSFVVAQVSGQVLEVAGQFENGGSFEKGDLLLRIDDRDYRANLKAAEAALLDAKRVLIEEQARGRLARDDWKRSGKSSEPDALVLREPQLLSAKAGLLSAEANLDKAKLDLERTTVRAPFAGRVLSRSVDLGQVVGINERLGEIYAAHTVRVRLPLRNRDLAFIDLSRATSRSESQVVHGVGAGRAANVSLVSTLSESRAWPARLVRTEAAIDNASRQLHVVAEVNDSDLGPDDSNNAIDQMIHNYTGPAGASVNQQLAEVKPAAVDLADRMPRIGQYVTAQILGKKLDSAIVVPLESIYQGSFVYLVEEGHVYRRKITIAWQNQHDALLAAGLENGEQLVLTPLGQVVSGTPVRVLEDKPDADVARKAVLQTP